MKLLILFSLILITGCTPSYEVYLDAEPEEFGEVSGGGTYKEGEKVELTAKPKDGYEISGWIKDGEKIGSDNSYQFEVFEDVDVKVMFNKIEYTVNLKAHPMEAGEVSGSGTYYMGEEVVVQVEPQAGYKFLGWKKGREKISNDVIFQFNIEDNTNLVAEFEITPEKLESLIDLQPLKVTSTKYIVQSDRYKTLYPDMLQAIIKNNSEYDIKNAVVAFVAWDKNNLPIKIKSSGVDIGGGSYLRKVNYENINLVPGDTFGEQSGFGIDSAIGVETFKAIVYSYETFEGESWENPYYNEFCEMYEDKRLD